MMRHAVTRKLSRTMLLVEVESSSSHPYFVMGAGWASCDPAATHLRYGLNVHKLQVGDVLISLTPREPPTPQSAAMSYTSSCSPASSSTAQSLCGNGRSVAAAASTVMTTATATAVTARQQLSSVNSNTSNSHHTPHLLATSSLLLKSSTQVSNHQQHQSQHSPAVSAQSQPINLHFSSHAPTIAPPMSPDSAAAAAAARKRRWSAPDEMCEEAELQIRRHRPSGHTPPE
ncbi:unnamed protein product [Acanthoscelides obtectus]|uniref:AXH domain-containing protein n=1 Tax=Acanthoscelides obtectus TaxID=200917 RepID=A0A9P0KST9_ACAOB|nr:unnamed protein product [Acanthoscelides obtectus]CAK1654847.1 Ataxin-1-like [Acanthoscelides obtectus]